MFSDAMSMRVNKKLSIASRIRQERVVLSIIVNSGSIAASNG